jgi:hypothetical protein
MDLKFCDLSIGADCQLLLCLDKLAKRLHKDPMSFKASEFCSNAQELIPHDQIEHLPLSTFQARVAVLVELNRMIGNVQPLR